MDAAQVSRNCPFRSVVPTTEARIGHAVTGVSARDCEGRACQLWMQVGDQEDCAFIFLTKAIIARPPQA